MNKSYWKQKATPWVSLAVLVGGLTSAFILFFLQNVQTRAEVFASPTEVDQYLSDS